MHSAIITRLETMQLLRSIAGQLFIVFFIHSFHNVKIQALPQSVLTASASSIGEEESVTLQCSAKAGNPPKKCWIYLISQTNGQKKNIAFKCQETFTGSVLLAENWALAEVKVKCFYAVDRQSNTQPAPHSDIVSITVALPQSVLTANASSIREGESVTLQCSAKAGHTPKQCYIYWLNQAKDQNKIAFDCQVTFTGSDLLARTGALAEVKVQCVYTNDRDEPAPHSDIVSITVRRVVTASPTPARPTSASSTSASPTPARPTPARPTSASPISASTTTAATTVVNPNSVVPGSPTSTSPTTAATTMVNSTSSVQYTPPENTMEMKSLNTGSSKVVNRSGSCIKKDGVYHVYSTISNEPSAPNQTLVYDLLQAN
ncbi:mucin-2-like isoform X3 [Gadus macrocephalus]|uniref:mucin-2-like isoform X3 n=1 Tax=Gadus macrocephalus TaxID=80720 RepID=UPI0028CBA455|nr:mucin-2-like isoform X3 [Gadus macrocephalus]